MARQNAQLNLAGDRPMPPNTSPAIRAKPVSRDAKFAAYMSLYENLDNLIWRNTATLTAATTLGFGATGFIYEKNVALPPFTAPGTVLMVSLLVMLLIVVGVYTAGRMRAHHERIEAELCKLDAGDYFDRRHANVRWYLSASYVQRVVFLFLGLTNISLSLAGVVGPAGLWLLALFPLATIRIKQK